MALLSLYPWNFGASGYFTYGDISRNQIYRSQSYYVEFDRRQRDYVIAGYELLEIDSGFDRVYRQENLLIQSGFDIKTFFQPGFTAGRVKSNAAENGWILGGHFSGYVSSFFYSAGYVYSELNGWNPEVNDTSFFHIVQWDYSTGWNKPPFSFSAGVTTTNVRDETRLLYALGFDYELNSRFYAGASFSFGSARFFTDTKMLTVINNPDELKRQYRLRLLYRFTPNFGVIGNYVRREYSPVIDNDFVFDYHAQYYSAGLNVRF